jgi:tetratricopeptide (TPR) repeat protein/tRNA A-37 threonylcarbamoyl transferase component Bud32
MASRGADLGASSEREAVEPDAEATEPGELRASAMGDADAEPPDDDRPAATIGRFALLHRVGAGAMGVVYAAFDDVLDRKVAIKLVAPRLAMRERARERMLAEAQALAKLRHPNVIQVYEAGLDRGRLFIAMEFVEGVTLERWLRDVPAGRPWREVLGVFGQAGRGLAAAHAADLVHCDFKPDNAMLSEDGHVRVMDFGLARAGGADSQSTADTVVSSNGAATHTERTGRVVGTPAYMAPEQWGRGPIDARSDQFSFCVALFEGLWGRRPFSGDTLPALATATLAGRIDEPANRRGVPERVRRAVLRGLATEPERRWPSMDALLRELVPDERPRRWWVLPIAGASLVSFGVLLIRSFTEPAPEPCATAAEAVVEAWSPEVAQRVREGLLAVGTSWAEPTAERTVAALDAYARALGQGRTDACEGTHVRHEQSETLMLQRVRCLDGRQRRLQALVGVLVHADVEVLENAVDAAHGLAPVEPCADLGYVSSEVPLPDDPAEAAAVADVEQQLADVEALHHAGKYAEALRRGEDAWQRAASVDHVPIRVEALNLLARSRLELGDHDAALASAREAYVISGTASRVDAADTHTMLGHILDQKGDYEQALIEYRTAAALWSDVLGPDDLQVARCRNDIGTVLNHQGRYDAALAELRAALVMQEAAGDVGQATITRNNIGATLVELGRNEEAARELQRALEIDAATLGATHPRLAPAHNNLGGALVGLRRYDEALVELRQALAIWTEAVGSHHPDVTTVRGNVGFVLLELDRHEDALAELEAVLSIQQQLLGNDHALVANTHHNIGRGLQALGRYSEALQAVTRAHETWRTALGPEHPDVALSLTSMAAAQLALGRPDEAVRAAEEAVRIYERLDNQPVHLGQARMKLAQALWASGRDRARSLRLAEQARDAFREAGAPRRKLLATAEVWISEHAPACRRDPEQRWTCPEPPASP